MLCYNFNFNLNKNIRGEIMSEYYSTSDNQFLLYNLD